MRGASQCASCVGLAPLRDGASCLSGETGRNEPDEGASSWCAVRETSKRSFDIEIPVPVPDIPFRTERQSYFFSRESHRNPGKGTSTETGDPISGCDVRDGRRIYRGRGRWCDRVDPSFGFFRRPQSRSAYPKLYEYVVRTNRVAMRPRRSTLSLTQLALASQTRACPRGGIRTPPRTPPSSLSGPLVVVFRFASLVRASLFLFFSLGSAQLDSARLRRRRRPSPLGSDVDAVYATQVRGFLNASSASASREPSSGCMSYCQRAVRGRDMRMDSMRPPVRRPKVVPRS